MSILVNRKESADKLCWYNQLSLKKYNYILDLVLVVTESYCKYMENRKATPTQNLLSCDIADSFQGAARGPSKKPDQLKHNSVKVKNCFLKIWVNLSCGEQTVKLLKEWKRFPSHPPCRNHPKSLGLQYREQKHNAKMSEDQTKHQQQFSMIFQASQMLEKIHNIIRSEQGHCRFIWPCFNTDLGTSLSCFSYWALCHAVKISSGKQFFCDLKTLSDRVAFNKPSTKVTMS